MHLAKSVTMNCADLTLKQNFSPNWSAEQTYGKMDPIATYSHTGREMTFGLVLLATTLIEAQNMQSEVDQLIKFQYPKYKSAGATGMVLSAPPFFKVSTLGGKLYSTVKGYMTAFDITPGSNEEIVPLVRDDGYFFERKYNIDFTMTILHTGLPGWNGAIAPGGNGGFVFTAQPGAPAPGQSQRQQVGATTGNDPDSPATGNSDNPHGFADPDNPTTEEMTRWANSKN